MQKQVVEPIIESEEKMTIAKDILRTDYLAADKDETLTRINSRIKNEAFSDVLVFDKEKLIGVFSPSRASMVTPSKQNMDHMRIEKLVNPIRCIDENTDLSGLISKILETNSNIIPISKQGKVIGVVHTFDILDAVKGKFEGLNISNMQQQNPIELNEEVRIGKAIEILHNNINDTILVRNKNDLPVGILNSYDLLRNLKLDSYNEDRKNSKGYKSERENMFALPVSDFIKGKTFVRINSKVSIPEVIEQFKINNVTSIIVDDLSSIVRSSDIIRYLDKSKDADTQAIYFVGLEELKIDDFLTSLIKEKIYMGFEKIKKIIQKDAILKVHIKRHFAAHESKRHKYTIVLHLEYSGNHVSIKDISEWDLEEAAKKSIKELESRINRIFRSNGAEARNSARSFLIEA